MIYIFLYSLTNAKIHHTYSHARSFNSLDYKNQVGISRNRPNSSTSICSIGRTKHFNFLPNSHVNPNLIPAFDNLPSANSNRQRLPSLITGIEFSSIFQFSIVMHLNLITNFRLSAFLALRENFQIIL